MIRRLKTINKRNYFVALGIVTLVYFIFTRIFQDWFYRVRGIDVRPDELFLSYGPDFFQPEPLEIILYLLGFLIIPLVAFFLTAATSQINRQELVALFIIGGAGITLALINNLSQGGFSDRFFVTNFILLLSLGFCVWYYFFGKFGTEKLFKARAEDFFKKFWPLGLVILAILIFNPSFPVDVHHFNFYLGSVNDFYQGKEILYESSNLYGLFNVYFLVALFKLIPLTFPMLALVSSAFYFLFFVGIYVFLRKWLRSYTLATLATAALVSILYFFPTGPENSALFLPALSPFRWGAYVIVLFFIFGFSRTQDAVYQQAALLLSALALFWNFDTGAYLTVATLGALGYLNFSLNRSFRPLAKLFGNYFVYLLSTSFIINVVNRLIYQAWPDWSLFLRDARFFTQGAAMTPLPAVGFFEIIVFTYLVTLVIALYHLVRQKKFDVHLVFLGIYGALSLAQYIGESSWELLHAFMVPFVLIIFFAFKSASKMNLSPRNLKLVNTGLLTFLIFSGLLLAFKLPIEFGNRNYSAVSETLLNISTQDQELYADAKEIAERYEEGRLPFMTGDDTKLLIYSEKANFFDFFYLFSVFSQSEMDKHIEQALRERPPVIFVGRARNDQIEYFLSGISEVYEPEDSLRTVDVYVLR